MNKPIPLHRRWWRGIPRIFIVLHHENDAARWIPINLADIACWIAAGLLIGATFWLCTA